MTDFISSTMMDILQLCVSEYFAPVIGCTIVIGVLGLIYMLTGKARVHR